MFALNSASMGVLDGVAEREISRTPFAIIDVETTGISPRDDRVIEIAVVLVKPGEPPQLVLETLVNPERPVTATEVHGITDREVAGAPTFREIAEHVVAAISNRVVVAHNASFDVRLLGAELERVGYPPEVPCMCTMFLARIIDPTAPRLTLESACARAGFPLEAAHTAASDALAAAKLFEGQLRALRRMKVRRFGDLSACSLRPYPFFESFELPPLPPPPAVLTSHSLRPRNSTSASRPRSPLAAYLDELLDALADLDLSEAEIDAIRTRGRELTPPQIRAAHAKVFWGMLSRFVEDGLVDEVERSRLRKLHGLLGVLGWAPGE